jgi:hypothetical protein
MPGDSQPWAVARRSDLVAAARLLDEGKTWEQAGPPATQPVESISLNVSTGARFR